MSERPDKFTQYRYLRCPWDNSLRQISFKITLDHKLKEIKYAFAVCKADENFDFKLVHALLDKRMKSKIWSRYAIYDQNLTLVQNVLSDIREAYAARKTMALKGKDKEAHHARGTLLAEAALLSAAWRDKTYMQNIDKYGSALGLLVNLFQYHILRFRFPYQI